MKKEYIKYGCLTLIFLLIFIFVYPTIYRYDKYDQKIPVRINRITGKTEMLYSSGWTVPAPAPQLDLSAYLTVTPSPKPTGISVDDFLIKQTDTIKNIELKLSISKKEKPKPTNTSKFVIPEPPHKQEITATIYNGNDKSLKSLLVNISVYKDDGTVEFERKYKLSNAYSNIEPFANSSISIKTDFDINENQKFDYKIISVEL